jgi:hypothetical protein
VSVAATAIIGAHRARRAQAMLGHPGIGHD